MAALAVEQRKGDRIDGDWKRLLRTMGGFHTVVCYGDYLKEIGYALKKMKVTWDDYSA